MSGLASARAARAARAATPYDGLIFRVTDFTTPGASGYIKDCPANVPGVSVYSQQATVIQSAAGGATPTTGSVTVLSNNGSPVLVSGVSRLAQAGLSLGFSTSFLAGCPSLPTIASSPAGEVYAVNWWEQICDNASCNVSHDGATGTGCIAISQSGRSMTATVEIGACNASAFPAPPAGGATATGLQTLKAGALDGMLLKFSGDSLGAGAGQGGVCGNSPKVKYAAVSASLQVLRRRSPLIILSGSVGFGMDVNTSNQAYTWGGGFNLVVKGRLKTVVFNQTDPNKPLQCSTRPKPSSFTGVLPVGLWAGNVYLGKAWMKATISSARTPWSVLVAFGKPNFSGS
jgi:hypothetical protein